MADNYDGNAAAAHGNDGKGGDGQQNEGKSAFEDK